MLNTKHILNITVNYQSILYYLCIFVFFVNLSIDLPFFGPGSNCEILVFLGFLTKKKVVEKTAIFSGFFLNFSKIHDKHSFRAVKQKGEMFFLLLPNGHWVEFTATT